MDSLGTMRRWQTRCSWLLVLLERWWSSYWGTNVPYSAALAVGNTFSVGATYFGVNVIIADSGNSQTPEQLLRTVRKQRLNTPVSMHSVTLGHQSWKTAMSLWELVKSSWAMRLDQQPRSICILLGILSVGPLKPMSKPEKVSHRLSHRHRGCMRNLL